MSVNAPWTDLDHPIIKRFLDKYGANAGNVEADNPVTQAEMTELILVASNLLNDLVGGRYPGLADDRYRPNRSRCCVGQRRTGCRWVREIELPMYPVAAIQSVRVDGVFVDEALYKVDDAKWLVQLPSADGVYHPENQWPCFPAGTTVLTDAGLTPIEDVRVGDLVMTHRGRWRRVMRAGQTGESETLLIRGQGGSIRSTPDHRFFSAELYREHPHANGQNPWKLGQPAWVEARDLVGQTWATLRHMETLGAPPMPTGWEDTEDFWWMVGRWVGDGWCSISQRSVVMCSADREADEVAGRLSSRWRRTQQRTTTRFRIADLDLMLWLIDHFGVGARHKHLPAWLIAGPERIRRAWLNGYVSADGWIAAPAGRTPFISCRTVSRDLALGVRMVATSLGFAPTMYDREQTTTHIEGRQVEGAHTYRVDWYTEPPRRKHYWTDDDYLWGRVRSVELDSAVVPVFDIEVEDDHSFIADGFIVHNCCQRVDLPVTEEETMEIVYTYGDEPPITGARAAARWSTELALADIDPSECGMNRNLVTVSRQGSTYQMRAGNILKLLSDGESTGMDDVDNFLAAEIGARTESAGNFLDSYALATQGRPHRRTTWSETSS